MTTDSWGSVAPAAITSVVTTLATLGVTSVWKSVSQKSKRKLFPVKLKRGSGNTYELISQSKRVFSYVYVNVGQANGQYRAPVGYPSPTILPNCSLPLGEPFPGETVQVQWHAFNRGKETQHYAEVIHIREELEEYEPRQLKEPLTHYGG